MGNLTMKDLEDCFQSAMDNCDYYVGVKIHMDGFQSDEIIVNQYANFEKKLEYYKTTYNEELDHKHAKGISIVGFTSADNFADIELVLMR